MLILSRKVGESIYVGDDIVVKLLHHNKHYVSLGIDAPESLKIYREELYEKIKSFKFSSFIKSKKRTQ